MAAADEDEAGTVVPGLDGVDEADVPGAKGSLVADEVLVDPAAAVPAADEATPAEVT